MVMAIREREERAACLLTCLAALRRASAPRGGLLNGATPKSNFLAIIERYRKRFDTLSVTFLDRDLPVDRNHIHARSLLERFTQWRKQPKELLIVRIFSGGKNFLAAGTRAAGTLCQRGAQEQVAFGVIDPEVEALWKRMHILDVFVT